MRALRWVVLILAIPAGLGGTGCMSRHQYNHKAATLAWSTRSGILLRELSTGQERLLALRDKSGRQLAFPPFAYWRGHFVFWSSADEALRVLQPDQKAWVAVRLPPGLRVSSLVLLFDECILNCNDIYGEPSACFGVNLVSLHVRRLPGVIEVRGSPGSRSYAARHADHRITLSPSHRVITVFQGDFVWDADTDQQVVYATNGRLLRVRGREDTEFEVPCRDGSVDALFVFRDWGELWYQVEYSSSVTWLKSSTLLGQGCRKRVDVGAPIERPLMMLTNSQARDLLARARN